MGQFLKAIGRYDDFSLMFLPVPAPCLIMMASQYQFHQLLKILQLGELAVRVGFLSSGPWSRF
jgi:hypothetical protein